MDNKDKIIKDAQYRKGLSIAFFNATNATIELAKVMFPDMEGVDAKAFIKEWRTWFLEEHKEYYGNVIANIGGNYDAKESIKKLEATKTIDDLKSLWISFSEDERRDPEVMKLKDKLKKQYEKA